MEMDDNFYTCAWSYEKENENLNPPLPVAGSRGKICIFLVICQCIWYDIGKECL